MGATLGGPAREGAAPGACPGEGAAGAVMETPYTPDSWPWWAIMAGIVAAVIVLGAVFTVWACWVEPREQRRP